MEMMTTREEALARRRVQNRNAQRRFRWKQNQLNKNAAVPSVVGDGNGAGSDPSPGIETQTQTHAQIPSQETTSSKRTGECFFSSKLSLFGGYTMLDVDIKYDEELLSVNDSLLAVANLPRVAGSSPGQDRIAATYSASTTRTVSHHQALPEHGISETPAPFHRSTSTRSSNLQSSGPRPQDLPVNGTKSSFASLGTHTQTPVASLLPNPSTAKEIEDDVRWQKPLHLAAQKGYDRIVHVLLQHQSDCNERDSDGLTPLLHATIGGHEHVVHMLLQHGARIGEQDHQGRTSLHLAVAHRREAVLKCLLQHYMGDQALVDGYDDDHNTPLHTAVDIDFEAGVRLLLEHGASLNCITWKN